MSWEQSLSMGQAVELYVLSRILKKYPKAYQLQGKNPKWDIFIPERGIGVEVKSDCYSRVTGNYVIEVSFDNKPSALTATKADYWVIFDGNTLVWITPQSLMRCILYNCIPSRRFKGGSDVKFKCAYLVDKDLIKRWSESIDTNLSDLPDKLKMREKS